MKLWFFCILCSVSCLLALPGCGPELTAGGVGVAAGVGVSETIKGMQMDLERREAALVQRYNDLLAAGAKAEDLAAVKQQLEQTQQFKQGVQTGERFLGTDWSNPQEAAMRFGEGAAFLLLLLSRRKLGLKYIASKTGQARLKELDPVAYEKYYSLVGTERTARGL